MAFFGLTQLGAQSTFNVNLISLQNYSCFAEEDFRAAFEKHSGGAASVSLDKVGPMLEEVFGGFAPEQEMEALIGTLQHFGGEITFDHIMTSVAAVAGAPPNLSPNTHQLLSCLRAFLSCQTADRCSGTGFAVPRGSLCITRRQGCDCSGLHVLRRLEVRPA